jgi:hypothetical protein
MGKSKASSPAPAQVTNPYQDQLAQTESDYYNTQKNLDQSYYNTVMPMMTDYYNQTGPLRSSLINQYSNWGSTGYDPTQTPLYKGISNLDVTQLPMYKSQYGAQYQLGREGLEGQFNQAKNSIMASSPMGGAMSGNLANLATQRASSVGSLPAQISSSIMSNLTPIAANAMSNAYANDMGQAYGAAFNTPATALSGMNQAGSTALTGNAQAGTGAMSGLGSAANSYATQSNAVLGAQQQNNMAQVQQMQQLGAGLGSLAGMGLMGGACCFIFLEASGGILDPVVRKYRDEHMTERNRRGYYRLSEKLIPLMRKGKIARRGVEICLTEPLTSYGRYFYGKSRKGALFAPIAAFWFAIFNLLGFGKFIRKNGEVI